MTDGASYPGITATVNVAVNAGSPLVNQVSVVGGGSASANGSDATNVSGFTVSVTPAANPSVAMAGGNGASYTVTVNPLNGFSDSVTLTPNLLW